jgi:hypothetical protein
MLHGIKKKKVYVNVTWHSKLNVYANECYMVFKKNVYVNVTWHSKRNVYLNVTWHSNRNVYVNVTWMLHAEQYGSWLELISFWKCLRKCYMAFKKEMFMWMLHDIQIEMFMWMLHGIKKEMFV